MYEYICPTYNTKLFVNTLLTDEIFFSSHSEQDQWVRNTLQMANINYRQNRDGNIELFNVLNPVNFKLLFDVFCKISSWNKKFRISFSFSDEIYNGDDTFVLNSGWVEYEYKLMKVISHKVSDIYSIRNEVEESTPADSLARGTEVATTSSEESVSDTVNENDFQIPQTNVDGYPPYFYGV